MNARDAADAGSTRITPLITAEDAFPLLEGRVATARESVELSFRVFDTRTKLRTNEAREAAGGDDWAALLVAVAARGVDIRLLVADFDPIGGAALHEAAWASLRHLDSAAAGAPGRIQAFTALHPARVGGFWRRIFRLRAMREVSRLKREYGDEIREKLPGLAPVLDGEPPQFHPATYHQKAAAVDDDFVMIGGLDLDERRWDTTDHDRPAEETWRDVTLAVDGPAAAPVRAAIRRIWNRALDEVTHRPAPPLPNLAKPEPAPPLDEPAGPPVLETRLTFSNPGGGPFSFGPQPQEDGTLRAAKDMIASASRFLYIETQFLRSAEIAEALAAAARARPELELVLILPFAPERYAFGKRRDTAMRHAEALQSRALRKVRGAFGPRAAILSPAKPSRRSRQDAFVAHGAGIVYVHSKVMIADCERSMVGSANLNGRSLKWDTELSALIHDAATSADLLDRIARSWLGEAADGPFDRLAPWRDAASENVAKPPDLREGFLLPHDERRARRVARLAPFIPDEMF